MRPLDPRVNLRRAKRGAWLTLTALVLYGTLLVYPEPLFAHTLHGDFVTAHADVPFPAEMERTLADAEAHVRTSPIFDEAQPHDVYFSQSDWRWRLVSHWNSNAGAIAMAPFGRAVFVRPCRLESNRMIGRSGREVEGERTLDYYVAHEVTHTMTADFLGPAAFHSLPVWVREGYADYVGRRGTFDYDAVRTQLLEGHPHTNPASGHYLRYVLLVAHELEQRGVSVEELLRHPRPSVTVEAEVMRGPND